MWVIEWDNKRLHSSYKPSATGAASNLGRSGTGVTKDYFDVNRTSTPDIGAVERR